MKIHYFQRYHSKENVSTGNTMLLISRLYHYSPTKFHAFLISLVSGDIQNFETDIVFETQLKSVKSVPDAQIKQNSFNIIIETKLGKNFDISQLNNHLKAFINEDFQILLTLSPDKMTSKQMNEVKLAINEENSKYSKNIIHIDTTFEQIITLISDVIDDRDYEFNEILNDYIECCSHEGLLSNKDRLMRAVTVGKTYDDNIKYKLYYDPANRGYSEHGFLALYKNKAIKAVGKIINVVEADEVNGQLIVKSSTIDLTTEQKNNILYAINSSKTFGWNVEKDHKFFCVDQFVRTDFTKVSKFPLQGTKFFDLDELLGKNAEKSSENIAKLLNGRTWR